MESEEKNEANVVDVVAAVVVCGRTKNESAVARSSRYNRSDLTVTEDGPHHRPGPVPALDSRVKGVQVAASLLLVAATRQLTACDER